jgi:DNA modification methylase
MVGIPWSVAFALRDDGWYLRSDIIWSKPNPMPESVTDRPTKAHEYIFLMSKSERYYYDSEAIQEEKVCWRARGAGRSKFNEDRNDNGDMAHFANEDLERGIRNKRSVWTIATQPFPEAHFATFPEELIKPCILAGCPAGGIVLDPFAGAGTTLLVAKHNGCRGVGIEIEEKYCEIAAKRLAQKVLNFG